MQSPPQPPFHLAGSPAPTAWPAPPPIAPAVARARRRVVPRTAVVVAVAVGGIAGVLLGGRVSTEDGIQAAREALASGNPARAVTLDDDIAARGGLLLLFDPGAADRAAADAQTARIAWAQQLAAHGDVDGAIAALAQVGAPGLRGAAATARTTILANAAKTALAAGHPQIALQRYDQALADNPPQPSIPALTAGRAAAEVPVAVQLLQAGKAVDALALLDDASLHGAAAAVQQYYPGALLAAGNAEIAAGYYRQAATTLNRLVTLTPASADAREARGLLRAPQPVAGTLVDGAGHAAAGRVRLGSHFTSLFGGYQTSGPFYYGTADANGDFSISDVPVGGPYVLEYYRNGGWQTLVDPHTDQPANPVTVTALTPVDLTFIVLPA